MRTWRIRTSMPWLLLLSLLTAAVTIRLSPNHRELIMRLPGADALFTFKTMLIGILLEALPFLLLGVAVSAFVQAFVSENTLRRLIPDHPLGGIAAACLLCLLFPLCECGIVPIVRRLMAKGLPVYIGTIFLLVGPIFNPIVYAATMTAFRVNPNMGYLRMGFGLFTGCLVSLIIYAIKFKSPLKLTRAQMLTGNPDGEELADRPLSLNERAAQGITHAGHEFFEMGKYLLLGSVLTAAIQTGIPRTVMAGIGHNPLTSSLLMMGLAYVMSLCSTSDAFVAASFAGTIPASALLAFLVLGPMLDFKSTLMMLSVFRTKFVLLLAALIILTVFSGAMLIHGFGPAFGWT